MIDQDAEPGRGDPSRARDALGGDLPTRVPTYGRVADSLGRRALGLHENDRRAPVDRLNDPPRVPDDLDRPLETFESSPIGEYLRRQRVLRDVSIDELSALTRIPARSLERLERGEFDGEADGFVRGFVRTVAEALGLDADNTVARILQEPAVGAWDRHHSNRRLKQGLAAGTLLALLGLGFLLLQAGWGVLVGANENDPDRQIVVWRDPVRTLAEATGTEVDPAGEIDPRIPAWPALTPSSSSPSSSPHSTSNAASSATQGQAVSGAAAATADLAADRPGEADAGARM